MYERKKNMENENEYVGWEMEMVIIQRGRRKQKFPAGAWARRCEKNAGG